MPSEKRRAPKEAHRTPVLALGSLRPRQRDIPWPEQAAAQTTHGGLPLDVRIAMAVTHALGQELGEATEEHQEQYGAYPYRTDLFAALGDRLGIHERTLRRTHGGHRWATLPELVMFLSDASLGPRLAARLRSLEVDLLAARPNLSRSGGLPGDPGTVEDMENDGYDLLEQEVRERVRVLASWQAAAAANHISTASQVNWLAVEGIMTTDRAPMPRAATAPEQLRSVGLSLAGLARDALTNSDQPRTVGQILSEVMTHVHKVQVDNDLTPVAVTRHQITDALKYLRGRDEVQSHEGRHSLTEGHPQNS